MIYELVIPDLPEIQTPEKKQIRITNRNLFKFFSTKTLRYSKS